MKIIGLQIFTKPIGFIIAGALASMVVYIATSSAFIKPLFKSETIIYVPLFVPARQMENQGIGFASDKEISGHIQILNSGKMKDTLNQIFNLGERYGIDESLIGGTSKLYQTIDNNVSIEKTRYSSVSIKVEDADPVMAAQIANKLVLLGDVIKEKLLMTNRKKAIDFAIKLEKQQVILLDTITARHDSLWALKEQGKYVNLNHLQGLRDQMDREFQVLLEKRNLVRKEQENLETPLPSSYVITEAIPSNKPVWPQRNLLSVVAFILVTGLFWLFKMLNESAKSN